MDPREITERHYRALKLADFKGYDVFDGLKSPIIRNTPLFSSKALRLAWIQLFKRSPVNLRPIAMVPRGYNPKGLALIIRGLVNMHRFTGERKYLGDAYVLADIILSLRASGRSYFCAGYDFFWQARAFSVPDFTPNMVVSTFAGHALLDLYDTDGDARWLEHVRGVGEFIEKELKLFEADDRVVFGYVPGEKAVVHNINLMASAFFARLYSCTGEEKHSRFASGSALYTLDAQRGDGAWVYGEQIYHQWIDNFHTGFNLVLLETARRILGRSDWSERISLGLDFHERSHFLDDMTPKYYDNSLYPIDIHNFAQGVETFITFGREKKARKLLEKAIETMWDGRKDYFYYQKHRLYTNRINYMRWSQAWMFYAMTRFLLRSEAR
jgi:hypothetical protein